MSWLQVKEIIILKCHFLLSCTTMNHFSIGLRCAMKSGFYTTASNDQLSGWTEKKLQSISQSQTCTRKGSWSLFGGLLPLWSTQLSESWWNHYIWKVWSENQWDALKTAMPVASTGQQKWPSFSLGQRLTARSHNQSFRGWMNWAMKFCLICHDSPDLALTSYDFFKHLTTFCTENASTTSTRQKMLSKSLSTPEAWIFTLEK